MRIRTLYPAKIHRSQYRAFLIWKMLVFVFIGNIKCALKFKYIRSTQKRLMSNTWLLLKGWSRSKNVITKYRRLHETIPLVCYFHFTFVSDNSASWQPISYFQLAYKEAKMFCDTNTIMFNVRICILLYLSYPSKCALQSAIQRAARKLPNLETFERFILLFLSYLLLLS